MLEFQKIEKTDFKKIDDYYRIKEKNIYTGSHRISEYAPGTIKMWHNAYDMEYALSGENLYLSAAYGDGTRRSYLFPLGPHEKNALAALRDHIREIGGGALSVIPEEYIALTQEIFGADHIVRESLHADRDWADYIYYKKDFENPTGRKHHKQKNLINRFIRENPDYAFEAIDQTNTEAVLRYFQKYALQNPATSTVDGLEFTAVCDILRNWSLYGMCGILLRTADTICGFTIGEVYKDTVFVHVEKAEKDKTGAFQTLSRELQRRIGGAAVYVNREEDMGLEGLRRSKLSYGPVRLDNKYTMDICFAKKTDISKESLFL